MTDNQEVVVDFPLLLESMDNDPHLMRIACKAFLKTSEQCLNELSEAVAKSNRRDIARVAHSIKSMVSTFGAACVKECCFELEIHALAADVEWLSSQFAKLSMLIEEMQHVVRHELESEE